MKIKTLPNGNLNLEGIEFITRTGYHCKIRRFENQTSSVTGKLAPCHYVAWIDGDGEKEFPIEYDSIVDCFRKKIWRVKLPITPTKILTSNYKFV